MASFVADAVTWNTTAGNKTVAITPAVGDLLVVVAANTGTTTDPTVTDDRGGTYTRINGCAKATSADEMHVYVRTELCQLAASHTITENVGGAGTGGGVWVARISGMEKASANAARQSAVQSNQAGVTTPAPVLARPVLSTNLVVGAIFNLSNPAGLTPPASHTERQDVGYATPVSGLETTTRDSGETATTITWGGTSATEFCSLVLELDCATATFHQRGKRSSFPPGRKMPRTQPNSQHPAYPTPQTVTFAVLISGLGALATNFVREQRTLQTTVSGVGTLVTNFVRDKRVLVSSIAGTGSVAVNYLARTRPLAVVISGVGAVTAALIRIKLMAVSIAGTGAVVANFVRTRALASTIAGVGTLAANFVRTTRVLASSIAGTGAVAASFVRTRAIAATIAGTGAVVANFIRVKEFAVSIAGTGAVVVTTIVRTRAVAVVVAGIGTLVSDLTGTGAAVVKRFRTLMGIGE